jgi:SAM-dependent methyltransferase
MSSFEQEVRRGDRFEFGRNWTKFLEKLDDDRIGLAERSLKSMLGIERLHGVRFLDAGSGSGLFSLAARRLGAEVHSFDFDPDSVNCTSELRRRYFPSDEKWAVERGSVLDPEYLARIGKFDVVYSWGCCITPAPCGRLLRMSSPWWKRAESSSSPSTTTRVAKVGVGIC